MNIRIDRLILRCRGVEPGTAQAAVRELGPALLRQLREGGGSGGNAASAAAIRVSAQAAPKTLADAVAGRVAVAVESKAASNNKTEKF
jgi:hypothetical protein